MSDSKRRRWNYLPINTNRGRFVIDSVDGGISAYTSKESSRFSLGDNPEGLIVHVVVLILLISVFSTIIMPLSSMPAKAGWWNPRELVTDGADNDFWSTEVTVSSDKTGNAYVVWVQGGDLDGSGIDSDIFMRKWNSTTTTWESRHLVTDDNLNNTGISTDPRAEIGPFGNLHIVWRDGSDILGSGSDMDIFWRMWNSSLSSWMPTELVTDDPIEIATSMGSDIAVDLNGNVHITWNDGSPSPGIKYRKRNATTSIWEPITRVSDNSTQFRWSHIATDRTGHIHIAWEDQSNISGASTNGNDTDIFYRSLDAISNKWSLATHINDDDFSDQNNSNLWDIASDILGNIHVVWEDLGEQSGSGSDTDMFHRKWNHTSGTWEPRTLISDNPANTGDSSDAAMSTDSLGRVHVVWGDRSDVDGAGPNYGDLFYKMWNPVTGLWESTISLTNDLLDQFLAYPPDIAVDGMANVFVVWDDDSGLMASGPDHDVYLKRFTADIAIPDYMPVDVSPSSPRHVLTNSLNPISAKVYNGGSVAPSWSTIAFYETPDPGSPFSTGNVPPLGTVETSSPYMGTWVAPSTPGTYEITIEVDYGKSLTEVSEQNNFHRIEFIVEAPPPPPTSPASLTTQVMDVDDIFLNWTASNSSSIDHYLIYRSTDQREFDFSTPTYNTSSDTDPLRTNWTDIDAANATAPTEYYYIVRTVNSFGMRSITSNTAGKWTKELPPGMSSFSLPLEPFESRNVSWYADSIPNTNLIRWMDSSGHWVTHLRGMSAGEYDIQAEVGRGYEISLLSSARFTFCGYPGSMIRFNEGLGESIGFRKSLTAQISGTNVVLDWNSALGSSGYQIFRANDRNGLHDPTLQPLASVPLTQTTWTDSGAMSSPGYKFYMVIPVDSPGENGSSTYSIGVGSIEYSSGSDTFALPLKSAQNHSLDWYCDAITDVAGMTFTTFEEWKYHAREMPIDVHDSPVRMSEGYQISVSGDGSTGYVFIGW